MTAVVPPGTRRRTHRFQQLLERPGTDVIMEAHNGLSARIVEEAGFDGIWASGLAISAALGVRDANEASWTQVLEVVEFMADATELPILLDADTGYGNFNNVRRLVRKLEQRGVAAMCIEDKLFPKTNSFIGEQQPLADMEEFAGKIRAAKDAQEDPDFAVVARTEAFISGWGLDEALRRAEAYHLAGADAILVHSKRTDPLEVMDFMRYWGSTCPIVIVPTTYDDTPMEVFELAKVSLVVWANQLLRSGIAAMQDMARRLHDTRSLRGIETSLVPVSEIFRLQHVDELLEAEAHYLPRTP